eukprot:PITA_16379
MTNMLKKDNEVKWFEEARKSFHAVKLALTTALVLISPDYSDDFNIFPFASKRTMAAVLIQKRDKTELPITCFIHNIRDAALKYNIIEKYFLALNDPEGGICRWIAALLEYYLEIKPTKLIKGQGLAKLMVESNLHALDINHVGALSNNQEEVDLIQVSKIFLSSPQYSDIIYVLQHLNPPPGMSKAKSRSLKLKASKYCIMDSALYWKDPEGEINPSSSAQRTWILTGTNYFTEWIKVIPTKQATYSVIIKFLETNILSRFGCPNKIITDNATTFKSKKMTEFCDKYNIKLGHSTTYYPQGNGLVESSNKSLINIIKKMLEANKKNWHKKLINALWADWVSSNKSLGISPFQIVYGVDTIFPSSLEVPVMKLLHEEGSEDNDIHCRINQLIHLQQTQDEVFQNSAKLHERIKRIYDWKTKEYDFKIGDVVLRWDARNKDKDKHGKFENLWKGPVEALKIGSTTREIPARSGPWLAAPYPFGIVGLTGDMGPISQFMSVCVCRI